MAQKGVKKFDKKGIVYQVKTANKKGIVYEIKLDVAATSSTR